MGIELHDHHCEKGYMCHIVDTSLLKGYGEINQSPMEA
jgi:hypothetical protein